jgi:hypothetical protein
MERIERLERANQIWRIVSIASLGGVLLVAGYAFSQRDAENPPAAQPRGANDVPVDPAAAPVTYMNFVRVSITPEEVILDVGVNTQARNEAVRINNRLVMTYFTAKRLSTALQAVVRQHETNFGNIEVDFRKRMVPGAKSPDGK